MHAQKKGATVYTSSAFRIIFHHFCVIIGNLLRNCARRCLKMYLKMGLCNVQSDRGITYKRDAAKNCNTVTLSLMGTAHRPRSNKTSVRSYTGVVRTSTWVGLRGYVFAIRLNNFRVPPGQRRVRPLYLPPFPLRLCLRLHSKPWVDKPKSFRFCAPKAFRIRISDDREPAAHSSPASIATGSGFDHLT
jgi:hypothetical protein